MDNNWPSERQLFVWKFRKVLRNLSLHHDNDWEVVPCLMYFPHYAVYWRKGGEEGPLNKHSSKKLGWDLLCCFKTFSKILILGQLLAYWMSSSIFLYTEDISCWFFRLFSEINIAAAAWISKPGPSLPHSEALGVFNFRPMFQLFVM